MLQILGIDLLPSFFRFFLDSFEKEAFILSRILSHRSTEDVIIIMRIFLQEVRSFKIDSFE